MNFIDMLKMRRSVYKLNNKLPISENQVIETIKDILKYVPDAFNMKSQHVLIISGNKNQEFWDDVYDILVVASSKKILRDKTDSFKAGFGTILYFYDRDIVDDYKKRFSLYADNFNNWAMQSNAMLQFAIWTAFANMKIGANLQHYNPLIDKMAHQIFKIPDNWILVAQMPFGGIASAPEPKPNENISKQIKIIK